MDVASPKVNYPEGKKETLKTTNIDSLRKEIYGGFIRRDYGDEGGFIYSFIPGCLHQVPIITI